MILKLIFAALALLCVWYIYFLGKNLIKAKKNGEIEEGNTVLYAIMGLIINFFDALGIGSLAVSTACFKLGKMMDDRLLPGTLNVATTTSLITEGFIYMAIVDVDVVTLLCTVICCMLGAYAGASFISKLPKRQIQIGMGCALIIVATLLILGVLGFLDMNGTAIGLRGFKLIIACVVCFILGVANCIGIGMFAPTMAMAALLGLSPITAYPIMTAGSGLLQPIASYPFIKANAYHKKISMVWAVVGPIGVILAATLVKSIPTATLKKIVIVVILYTAINLFFSAAKEKKVPKVSAESADK